MFTESQAAVIKARLARGDKQHDIAADLGVNGGRIAEIKMGLFHQDVAPAPVATLPPAERRTRLFIDPNSPVNTQIKVLNEFIGNPPGNSRIITFTPDLCAFILNTLNNNNRNKRRTKIKRFAGAMTTGEFLLTGDTVKFSREGVLLDGQNRLMSCVRANVPFTTHVVFGVDPRAFSVIDANSVRTPNDTFKIAGMTYPDVSAQAIRWLMIFDENPTNRGQSFANTDLLKYYNNNVDEERFDLAKSRAVIVQGIPRGCLLALLYRFEAQNAKAAERFARDLAENQRGAQKLISKLNTLRRQSQGRLHENQVNALIIQAWHAYRKNIPLTVAMLNWTETKDFPTIG